MCIGRRRVAHPVLLILMRFFAHCLIEAACCRAHPVSHLMLLRTGTGENKMLVGVSQEKLMLTPHAAEPSALADPQGPPW